MSDPSSPKSNVPSTRLDRAALERVLARAAELQIGPNDTGEEFTEEQLIELGKEVGLPAQHLRQALAEERTRSIVPADEGGLATSIFGPSRARAGRTVSGRAADVLQAIDGWMQREELLIVKRHHAERIVWEPRQDFFVGIKRALKMGGRDYALSHAFEVSATVIGVDNDRVHVGLDADFSPGRSRAVKQTVGTTVFGGVAGAALFAMGFPGAAGCCARGACCRRWGSVRRGRFSRASSRERSCRSSSCSTDSSAGKLADGDRRSRCSARSSPQRRRFRRDGSKERNCN